MNAVVKTHVFKTGNSVAVRLPKEFGFDAGEGVELVKRGRNIEIRPVIDPDKARAENAALVAELRAIGPVPGAEAYRDDGRIEFPDRPGLY
jgi:antitoxin VapB